VSVVLGTPPWRGPAEKAPSRAVSFSHTARTKRIYNLPRRLKIFTMSGTTSGRGGKATCLSVCRGIHGSTALLHRKHRLKSPCLRAFQWCSLARLQKIHASASRIKDISQANESSFCLDQVVIGSQCYPAQYLSIHL
jgi:hypothetical protein